MWGIYTNVPTFPDGTARYTNKRHILRKASKDIIMSEILGMENGIEALRTFIQESRVFKKTTRGEFDRTKRTRRINTSENGRRGGDNRPHLGMHIHGKRNDYNDPHISPLPTPLTRLSSGTQIWLSLSLQRIFLGLTVDQMHTIEKSLYILPTDERERKRLDIQNEVFRETLGGFLIAPVELQAGDKVLDSGTGSASWLLDCYNAHKDVTFHGIDLKTDIFPKLDDEQQRQIHLEAGNVLELPSDWSNKFQLVNQRLLIGALSEENWNTALEQIYRVLAPGGWVQLFEYNLSGPGDATQRHFAMLEELYAKRGLFIDCTLHIPDILRNIGFGQIKKQQYEACRGGLGDEDGLNIKARKSRIGAYRSLQALIVTMGIRTEEEVKEIVDDLEREWESDAQSTTIICTFVAQKPVTVSA